MKTDAKLREALKPETEGAVVLIVAQRISTIKDAYQIVVLDGGKVVGKGKHFELLNTCLVYEDIVRSQLSDSEFKNEMRLAKNRKSEVKNG
jgi:ATP-binding cassette subfamily B protein